MKFKTVQIHFLSDISVYCHPEILLPKQRDVTTSPLYGHYHQYAMVCKAYKAQGKETLDLVATTL